jgi:hypothetical protein
MPPSRSLLQLLEHAPRHRQPARSAPAPAFDPRFLLRSPLFWPIAGAARAVVGESAEFPPVESFGRVFAHAPHVAYVGNGACGVGGIAEPPVRFEQAAPRPRRRGRRNEPIDPRALYDARITLDRVVPSRAGSWHDLMNALVWGTFPRAKAALHARQHRAISARIPPGARTLPPSRTRELDALALLDEGGVILAAGPTGAPALPVVFGHAIYESLAIGIPPAVVAAIEVSACSDDAATGRDVRDADGRVAARLAALDAALADVIDDASRLRSPEDLRRLDLAARA